MALFKNEGWTVDGVAAECTSGDSESWDVIIEYKHEDGRRVHEIRTLTLMGEVLVDGERPEELIQDGFLDDVDEFYWEAMANEGDEREVTRNYFFMSHSETLSAGQGDDVSHDLPTRVESDALTEPRDLDYSDARESPDLDEAVTAHLEDWGRDWGRDTLAFNDMSDTHRMLTA